MWDPNPGPLQGQQVLFTSKPCLLSVLVSILDVICEASTISGHRVTGCFKIHINRLHVVSPPVYEDQGCEDSQFTLSLLARISWEISGSPETFLEHFYYCLLGLLQGGSIEYPVTWLDLRDPRCFYTQGYFTQRSFLPTETKLESDSWWLVEKLLSTRQTISWGLVPGKYLFASLVVISDQPSLLVGEKVLSQLCGNRVHTALCWRA